MAELGVVSRQTGVWLLPCLTTAYTKRFALVTLIFNPPPLTCDAATNVGVADWGGRLHETAAAPLTSPRQPQNFYYTLCDRDYNLLARLRQTARIGR